MIEDSGIIDYFNARKAVKLIISTFINNNNNVRIITLVSTILRFLCHTISPWAPTRLSDHGVVAIQCFAPPFHPPTK